MASAGSDVRIKVEEFVDVKPILVQPATKSSIIDQELHRHGMGRYQWLIWAICGTGFFLGVVWAQSFGLAVSNIQRELGFSDKEFGNISVAFSAGLTAGAFIWGVLVDIVGSLTTCAHSAWCPAFIDDSDPRRRVAFLGTSLISGVFGMCLGALSSYNGLLVIVAFTAFGIGGNIPIDTTITVEYLPADRFYLLAALSIFQPLGVVTSSLIAFGLIPNYSCSTELVSCRLTGGVTPCCSRSANMGWRYLFFTVASMTLGVFIIRFFIFPFYESPKFLLSKGDDQGAVEVVCKIAAFNKHPCDLKVESLYEQCKELQATEEMTFSKRVYKEVSRLKLLFGSWRMARITILVWVTWTFDHWGFGIAGAYLPTILQRKNSAIDVSLRQTYIDYLIVYTPSIVAVILCVLMVRAPMVGRKWTLVFSSMIMGISLFLYSVVNTQASHIGFNMLEYFCQSLFNAALFGWTPEAFPAAVRGTATGLASFFGSLLGICGALIAAQLFARTDGSNAVLYLAGSGLFVSTIALLCIPTRDMIAPR